MNVAGVQGLSAEAPVPFLDFVDFNQRVRTKRFTFDGDHRFGHFLDNLLFLCRSEHVFDHLNIYEWHFVSFRLLGLVFGWEFFSRSMPQRKRVALRLATT